MDAPDPDAVRADIARLWNMTPEGEGEAAADAWEALDRATALRRASASGSRWGEARLAEGLARLYVARQMAEWGNRSYALQALEAAMDGLRDAIASLPAAYVPAPAEVAAFREAVVVEWRAGQSEPTQERYAALSIPALRRAAARK